MAARRLGWCRRQVPARLLALTAAGGPTPSRYLQRLRQRRSMQVEEGLAQLLLADSLLVNSFCGALYARASICAFMACNTPAQVRAMLVDMCRQWHVLGEQFGVREAHHSGASMW